MGKRFFLIAVVFLAFTAGVFSQITEADRSNIKEIYENADRLFLQKNYAASLAYLKKEGAAYLTASDSLQYLKIKNLENLYHTDLGLTKELESSLKLFFAKGNKYAFPELKYAEITSVFSAFQGFKEKDKLFYDSVSRVTNLEKVEVLPAIKTVVSDYLTANVNTYYNKELNDYITGINNKLTQVAIEKKKMEQDSIYGRRVKDIGKKKGMDLSYLVPSGGKKNFTPLNNQNEIVNFFDGKYTGSLGDKYALNASLGNVMINIYTGTRAKFALDWQVFDGEYAVFDWSSNVMLKNAETSGSSVTELKSIKAGTRIGPLVAVLLTKKIALGLYYSARPGIQFLMKPSYFTVGTGSTATLYEVKPVIANFNFSNEVGVKFYFFGKIVLNPYLHFGTYNWKNDIQAATTVVGGPPATRTQANYKFNNAGIRIGF